MTKFSPAAQAVKDAAQNAYWKWDAMCPADKAEIIAAAALRTAADQVVPADALYARSCCEFVGEQCRASLLAIAAELEGTDA